MIILSVKVNAQGEASLGNSLWPSPRIPNTLTPKLIYIYNSQNKQKNYSVLSLITRIFVTTYIMPELLYITSF
jgi:hypothetical protein